MKKYVQSIDKGCSLFIRGMLETESILDMILAVRSRKTKESKGPVAEV